MLPTLLATIAVPFGAAALCLALGRRGGTVGGWAVLLAAASVSVLGLVLLRATPPELAAVAAVEWIPSLGIEFGLRADRLGVTFVLLIGVIGMAVAQYARRYLGHEATAGFWALLASFMGAMLGVVLSDNLVLLFVFWELTTITSALLIGWHTEDPAAIRGAVQSFLVTGFGSLALLAGIVLLATGAGTANLSELEGMGATLVEQPRFSLALVLMLLGAFAKSAQFPLHFWLPNAMAAPTPVSAYLHSATMVKAGIVLIARLFPIFATSPLWLPLVGSVGLATFVVGGWAAMRAHDVKRLLAYSTVAYLGMLCAQYGFAARTGFHDASLSIANHAFYKSALFMLAGWIEKRTGTRDLPTLATERWLAQAPFGAALVTVGALAMLGAPLLLGFAAKELFFETAGEGSRWSGPVVAAAVAASALGVGYSARLVVAVFFGPKPPNLERAAAHAAPSRWLVGLPALLLVPQVLGGLAPRWLFSPLDGPGAGVPPGVAVWHGVDRLLAMSVATYAVGLFVFWARDRILWLRRRPGPEQAAAVIARDTLAGAAWLGSAVQAGGHPRQISLILVFVSAALVGGAAWKAPLALRLPAAGGSSPTIWLPVAMIVFSAIGAVLVRQRIPKVIMLGVAGFGVALYFVLFRAPDLALTQVLVEIVTLILLLLVFRRLPALVFERRRRGQKLAHAAVAVGFGLAMGLLTWSAAAREAPDPAGAEHLRLALPEGHGRNVVNVILVDFRGTDTLGEITVLVIGALGGAALLARAARETRA